MLLLSKNTLGATGAERVDVLGPESETDDAGGNSLQDGPVIQQADNPVRRWGRAACQHAAQKLVVDEDLHPLRGARWKLRRRCTSDKSRSLTAPLRKGPTSRLAAATASWMARLIPTPPTGVTDAQEPRPVPSPQAIVDGQELDVIPAANLADPIVQVRHELDDRSAEHFEAPRPHFVGPALRDEKSALPIISAIDHHHHLASDDATERFRTVAWSPRQAHPQHIDGCTKVVDYKSCALAHH